MIQIVNGDGKTGAMLASHMDINKISFTGSVSAGKKVQELAEYILLLSYNCYDVLRHKCLLFCL